MIYCFFCGKEVCSFSAVTNFKECQNYQRQTKKPKECKACEGKNPLRGKCNTTVFDLTFCKTCSERIEKDKMTQDENDKILVMEL